MFRRVIVGLVLGPALLIGSLAWSGYLALETVFDEERSETIARELLDNDDVRRQVAANLGAVIEGALPDDVPVSSAQIDAAALAVLEDPRVTDLLIESLGTTHRAFLGEGDAPETIDLNPVADVTREQIAQVSPAAANTIPLEADWTVDLPTERIPNASPVKSFLDTVVPYLAGASVVMVVVAFLGSSDRASVLRRAAVWAIGTTAVYLLLGLGVPELLRMLAPEQGEVLAALLSAVLRSTLVPSLVLAGVGVGLLVLSWIWAMAARRRPQRGRGGDSAHRASRSTGKVHESTATDNRPDPAPTDVGDAVPTHTSAFEASIPAQPPTTHVPPVRPQSAGPPQQPVTPPSTPIVPAPISSPNPIVDPFAPSPDGFAVDASPMLHPDTVLPPPVITGDVVAAPPSEPPPFRPTLPTRAAPSESVSLPAWSGDLTPTPPPDPRSRPPRWVDGHGWVLDPEDERPIPNNARYVEGVGYVVPGPPPRQ